MGVMVWIENKQNIWQLYKMESLNNVPLYSGFIFLRLISLLFDSFSRTVIYILSYLFLRSDNDQSLFIQNPQCLDSQKFEPSAPATLRRDRCHKNSHLKQYLLDQCLYDYQIGILCFTFLISK